MVIYQELLGDKSHTVWVDQVIVDWPLTKDLPVKAVSIVGNKYVWFDL